MALLHRSSEFVDNMLEAEWKHKQTTTTKKQIIISNWLTEMKEWCQFSCVFATIPFIE